MGKSWVEKRIRCRRGARPAESVASSCGKFGVEAMGSSKRITEGILCQRQAIAARWHSPSDMRLHRLAGKNPVPTSSEQAGRCGGPPSCGRPSGRIGGRVQGTTASREVGGSHWSRAAAGKAVPIRRRQQGVLSFTMPLQPIKSQIGMRSRNSVKGSPAAGSAAARRARCPKSGVMRLIRRGCSW